MKIIVIGLYLAIMAVFFVGAVDVVKMLPESLSTYLGMIVIGFGLGYICSGLMRTHGEVRQ